MPAPEVLSRVEKGAWAESFATQWLLERGFWVAKSIAGQGPFDIVAVSKEGTIHLFDVKYISRNVARRRKDPSSVRLRSELQIALSIRLFIVTSDHDVLIEPPFDENNNNGRT
jgi:Holliday junction resolvase-like predicted endonuclease